jgi:hypothetical protein
MRQTEGVIIGFAFADELSKLAGEEAKKEVIDFLGDRERALPAGIQEGLKAQLGASAKFFASPEGKSWLTRGKRMAQAAEGRSPLQWVAKKMLSARAALRRGL